MRRFSSILVAGLLLASCNAEETADDEKVEVEQEQTEVVNPETELDEDYKVFLEHHTESELNALKVTGEKLMYVYFSKLDDSLYSEVKEELVVGAQSKFENYVGVLDFNKDYEVQNIESDFIQGFDAPEVHILYKVDFVEISDGKKSDVQTFEFIVTALDWKDREGLGISDFENKTVLENN
ncbi:hypothetical protein MKX47_20295 [Solibacillus sp. FSL R7-0668]|uniref:hypothetical protein n=1 Tax=Solibacillus sp. FSL R7-0668 TaxID=2921688 RepID=UPI0030F73D2D